MDIVEVLEWSAGLNDTDEESPMSFPPPTPPALLLASRSETDSSSPAAPVGVSSAAVVPRSGRDRTVVVGAISNATGNL